MLWQDEISTIEPGTLVARRDSLAVRGAKVAQVAQSRCLTVIDSTKVDSWVSNAERKACANTLPKPKRTYSASEMISLRTVCNSLQIVEFGKGLLLPN